mmetsp:Transcript_51543/g.172004  ORF Transcript_51543/g.172004 Transcript_51543/m.172004 type:complete len:268 (-) Transcript_51543:354-1157(-)
MRQRVAPQIERAKLCAHRQRLCEDAHLCDAPAQLQVAELLHSAKDGRRNLGLQLDEHPLVLAIGDRHRGCAPLKLCRRKRRGAHTLEGGKRALHEGAPVSALPSQGLHRLWAALELCQRRLCSVRPKVEAQVGGLDQLADCRLEKGPAAAPIWQRVVALEGPCHSQHGRLLMGIEQVHTRQPTAEGCVLLVAALLLPEACKVDKHGEVRPGRRCDRILCVVCVSVLDCEPRALRHVPLRHVPRARGPREAASRRGLGAPWKATRRRR